MLSSTVAKSQCWINSEFSCIFVNIRGKDARALSYCLIIFQPHIFILCEFSCSSYQSVQKGPRNGLDDELVIYHFRSTLKQGRDVLKTKLGFECGVDEILHMPWNHYLHNFVNTS